MVSLSNHSSYFCKRLQGKYLWLKMNRKRSEMPPPMFHTSGIKSALDTATAGVSRFVCNLEEAGGSDFGGELLPVLFHSKSCGKVLTALRPSARYFLCKYRRFPYVHEFPTSIRDRVASCLSICLHLFLHASCAITACCELRPPFLPGGCCLTRLA
jgi:hypothetical protein